MDEIEPTSDKQKKYSIQVIIIFAFAAITQIVDGFYAIYDISPPGAFVLLSYIGIFWMIGDWFMKDSKKYNIDWAFDMGFFLYIFWPIFIPYYLFKTRGLKNAVIFTFGFVILSSGSYYLSFEFFYRVMP